MPTIEISWGTVKSLLIFFGPVLLPRLITAYRSLRVSIASRPPSRPLPTAPGRALNVLFVGIVVFLLLSLPFNPHAPEQDIFSLTKSRITTPTDVLFTRLARFRTNGLTATDHHLQSKLTSMEGRKIYLTYGTDALLSCQYCSLDNFNSYIMFYIPFYVLLPHLVHFLILGIATSEPFAGREASRWRTKFTLVAFALAALDVFVMSFYNAIDSGSAAVRAGQETPSSMHNDVTTLRFLFFVICDVLCATVIWLTATNRFFFKPPSTAEQVDGAVDMAVQALTGANSKLHASSVTRNAVVRDSALKNRDDVYWQAMAASENPTRTGGEIPNNIWDEEEVARAMSRAMAGQGGIDLAQLGVNASEFVRGVTEGL